MKAPAKSSGSSSPAVSTPAPSAAPDPGRKPEEHGGLDLFPLLAEHEHEQVSVYYDPSTGYRGIIAIHSTVLGPALGGTRFWNYQSDRAALIDALRLARGMTYKAAVAGLNLGGGKSVIIGDNRTTRREALFRAHGRHVESLKGRYITAEDVGTSTSDMEFIKAETNHVTATIFAPCALGAVINDDTVQRLQVEIVAGAANNELAEDRHGDELERRGITYAPDYVINGGGLINVNAELHGWAPERARSKAGEIYDTLLRVFEIAREEGVPTYRAADRLAEQRIAAIAKVRRNFV